MASIWVNNTATSATDIVVLRSTSVHDDKNASSINEPIRRASSPFGGIPLKMLNLLTRSASPQFGYVSPTLHDDLRDSEKAQLFDHFCNVLSRLIVLREGGGNLFQQLIVPLSQHSQPVREATYALAGGHLEYRGQSVRHSSVYFYNRAIRSLRLSITRAPDTCNKEALTTIILLICYEALVQNGHSNMISQHLHGVMALLNSYRDTSDPTRRLLERAFVFYDVVTALSLGTVSVTSNLGRRSLQPLNPLSSQGNTAPGGSSDAFLSMTVSLWPIMHKLSSLHKFKSEVLKATCSNDNSKMLALQSELYKQAKEVEDALLGWYLQCGLEMFEPGQKKAPKPSVFSSALAYRHSALVFLYRTFLGHSRGHHLVQHHVSKSLEYCMATVTSNGPLGTLLWPLFIAAVDAENEEQRKFATDAFLEMDRRQGMQNIARAWCIVQEVWRRMNPRNMQTVNEKLGVGIQTENDWRTVRAEMGFELILA
ncbi:fungal zn binuclear cluster domain-containing protein [Pochonia chlamydosporia 170]|uniref:Fungal zn binuclear cluster domain-containing protein n=1 Tax=Pochonia chlamydosporia 170 TaxID=1380566 RepID=A0A179FAB7_METCM|nr:fungal zn binuclear cluster domain-containing protein [Pochonia chlamydosporia 170]OAQ62475.1 fungal zn binuclear cluster domain-containing protein [Pochonia chlamydosporia 170]